MARLAVLAAGLLLLEPSGSAWAPTWAMNESTIILWRNASRLQPAADFADYGVVMLDWSHAAGHWINDFSPMDDGAALAQQCAATAR